MEIGWGKLDLDALFVAVGGVEMLEQCAVICERQLKAREMAFHCRLQLCRQARRELLVIFVDESVLVAQREGIRHAHADILVSADHLCGALLDRGQPARQPAVQVLHSGDPGCDHLKGGVERVEIEVDLPADQTRHKPQFQRHVRGAVLHGGQPDMVVAIDKPRQYHLAPSADDRDIGIAR